MKIGLTRNFAHYLISLVVHVISIVRAKQMFEETRGKFDSTYTKM